MCACFASHLLASHAVPDSIHLKSSQLCHVCVLPSARPNTCFTGTNTSKGGLRLRTIDSVLDGGKGHQVRAVTFHTSSPQPPAMKTTSQILIVYACHRPKSWKLVWSCGGRQCLRDEVGEVEAADQASLWVDRLVPESVLRLNWIRSSWAGPRYL